MQTVLQHVVHEPTLASEFVEKAPVGLTVTVVTYQSKGKLGYDLGLEEGADVE